MADAPAELTPDAALLRQLAELASAAPGLPQDTEPLGIALARLPDGWAGQLAALATRLEQPVPIDSDAASKLEDEIVAELQRRLSGLEQPVKLDGPSFHVDFTPASQQLARIAIVLERAAGVQEWSAAPWPSGDGGPGREMGSPCPACACQLVVVAAADGSRTCPGCGAARGDDPPAPGPQTWFSVADRLPENDCDALVWLGRSNVAGGYPRLALYDSDGQRWLSSGGGADYSGNVTHWQPLSAPPPETAVGPPSSHEDASEQPAPAPDPSGEPGAQDGAGEPAWVAQSKLLQKLSKLSATYLAWSRAHDRSSSFAEQEQLRSDLMDARRAIEAEPSWEQRTREIANQLHDAAAAAPLEPDQNRELMDLELANETLLAMTAIMVSIAERAVDGPEAAQALLSRLPPEHVELARSRLSDDEADAAADRMADLCKAVGYKPPEPAADPHDPQPAPSPETATQRNLRRAWARLPAETRSAVAQWLLTADPDRGHGHFPRFEAVDSDDVLRAAAAMLRPLPASRPDTDAPWSVAMSQDVDGLGEVAFELSGHSLSFYYAGNNDGRGFQCSCGERFDVRMTWTPEQREHLSPSIEPDGQIRATSTRLPRVGDRVRTPDGHGVVTGLSVRLDPRVGIHSSPTVAPYSADELTVLEVAPATTSAEPPTEPPEPADTLAQILNLLEQAEASADDDEHYHHVLELTVERREEPEDGWLYTAGHRYSDLDSGVGWSAESPAELGPLILRSLPKVLTGPIPLPTTFWRGQRVQTPTGPGIVVAVRQQQGDARYIEVVHLSHSQQYAVDDLRPGIAEGPDHG